jgi:hypothetical protein
MAAGDARTSYRNRSFVVRSRADPVASMIDVILSVPRCLLV